MSNAQKTPLAISLQNAAYKKAQDAIALLGKALPAEVVSIDGFIVTVKFLVTTSLFTLPNVQCPLASSKYSRDPIQPGDQGQVFPSDVYLGGVSGLGGGSADLSLPGNLSALTFFPTGSKEFPAPTDPNAFEAYGPTGTILRDSASVVVLKLQPTICVLDLPAGVPLVINGNMTLNGGLAISGRITAVGGGTYAEPFETTGNIIAGAGTGDQVGLQTHTHTQPNDSHGDTEQPTSAPTPGT